MAASFVVTTGSLALTASATKSLILLAPGTPEAKITQLDISMNATAVSPEVQFDLYRVTTLGSPAGTSTTPLLLDAVQQAAATSALTALTTEPTTVVPLYSYFLQPLGGVLVIQYPLGREPTMTTAGARWGLRYVAPAGVSNNAIANITFEE